MRCVIVMDIRVRIDRQQDSLSMTLTGHLDIGTSGTLSDAVDAFAATTFTSVVVDLADVEVLDCAGLGALVAAGQRVAAAGGTLTVVHPRPEARKLIALSGCMHLLRRPSRATEHGAPRSLAGSARRVRAVVTA